MAADKADEAGGLSPVNEDNAVRRYFARGKPCLSLSMDAATQKPRPNDRGEVNRGTTLITPKAHLRCSVSGAPAGVVLRMLRTGCNRCRRRASTVPFSLYAAHRLLGSSSQKPYFPAILSQTAIKSTGLFYFPDRSTAWRTKLIAGTCFGSFAWKRICGVLGSCSGAPSISRMPPICYTLFLFCSRGIRSRSRVTFFYAGQQYRSIEQSESE